MVSLNYNWKKDPEGISNIAYNIERCFRLVAQIYAMAQEKSEFVSIDSVDFASTCWATNCFFEESLEKILDYYGCANLQVSVVEKDGSAVLREGGFDPVTSLYNENYDENVRKFIEKSKQFERVVFWVKYRLEQSSP